MIRLNPTDKLQAVLSGAVASLQPQATVFFSDQSATGYSGGSKLTLLNSTTDVDIANSPAASTIRDVDCLQIYNRDSASVTVSIKIDVGGTDSIIITVTLATSETLEYTHSDGWKCIDANGRIKTTSVQGAAGASGDIQYSNGAGLLQAEAALNYDSATNILTVDNIRTGVDGSIRFDEHSSAPATPASGNVVTYSKANGRPYGKDDTGQEFEMFASQRAADGRLTLTTATPVMTADVSNSTSIFYTPYLGNHIALYDGAIWTVWEFSELTNTTTDATKNPAAVANDSNYDLFVWNDAGTLRLGRGPAWTSDTARGTGAGTTELERVNGTWVNKIAITNGPAAQRGRYVGTVRSDGAATIDWETTPAASAGGTAARLCVWNMYNRRLASAQVRDSTDTWTYNSTTIRAANNSNGNRINAVFGMNEDISFVQYLSSMSGGASGDASVGVGLDSTTAETGLAPYFSIGTNLGSAVAIFRDLAGLGFHFFQALEVQPTSAASTATFTGDVGQPTKTQSGIMMMGMF